MGLTNNKEHQERQYQASYLARVYDILGYKTYWYTEYNGVIELTEHDPLDDREGAYGGY